MLKNYKIKYIIRKLNPEAMPMIKKFGLIPNTLKQRGVATLKTCFGDLFIYYI